MILYVTHIKNDAIIILNVTLIQLLLI